MANPKSTIPNPQSTGWLEVGTIVAPQGLRGEMRVYPSSDFPERFEVPGQRWLLRPGQTQPQEIQLLGGRYLPGKNLYVVTVQGVNSREDAEALRDCKLMVRGDDRPELEEGEYHYFDLIDLAVYVQDSGELIGTVVDVLSAGHDLLEVKRHQGEGKNMLIPFVNAIVPVVDLVAQRIEITPPPGLLEI